MQFIQDQVATQQADNQLPPPVVPFLINPALAGNTPWDFATPTGLNIYLAALQPLVPQYGEDEEGLG